jgi:hypothetical protein
MDLLNCLESDNEFKGPKLKAKSSQSQTNMASLAETL